jgi:hypothetical protein
MTSQEIGRLAGRIFMCDMPEYLVVRNQQDQEDYGIDYEMEVMLPGDRASGVIFKVQEKGTTDLGLNAAGDQISYSDLKTARMRYYLRELRIPAALVVVDVTKRDVYWVRLQGNAEVETDYEAAAAAGRGTMTVHLPVRNKLLATLPEFLDDMVKCQDAVMVRYLRDISSQKVLDAAGSLPDFDATLRAARAHADILRLEQVERTLRAGDMASAVAECRRILPSESETAEARLAAGLNIIRLAPPMQPPPRSAEQQRRLVEERLDVTARMCAITAGRPAGDRLRLFAEFQDHLARLAARTNQLVEVLDGPRVAGVLGSTVREIAIRQLVVEIIAEFQEAYERLAGMIRGGHVELIAQSWAMLVAELLVFIHLARGNGYDALTTGLIAWIDATLPQAVKFAEGMGDWTGVVFCALQQIPLAPFGDVQEINRRADIARSYIGKLPEGEQQRHLDAVARQVAILLEPSPEQS